MKKLFLSTITLVILLLLTLPVHASIISVSGPISSAGVGASIIAAPLLATDAAVTNQAQQGFNEAQGVLTSIDFTTDAGLITAGTEVNSHMIFLNKGSNISGNLSHSGVDWTFDGVILGVMSDSSGNLEFASTFELGNASTTYDAPFTARGMEGSDSYLVSGNTITVDMLVSQPGDWIRVVTASAVPSPGTLLLIGMGLFGLIASRSRFSKNT